MTCSIRWKTTCFGYKSRLAGIWVCFLGPALNAGRKFYIPFLIMHLTSNAKINFCLLVIRFRDRTVRFRSHATTGILISEHVFNKHKRHLYWPVLEVVPHVSPRNKKSHFPLCSIFDEGRYGAHFSSLKILLIPIILSQFLSYLVTVIYLQSPLQIISHFSNRSARS